MERERGGTPSLHDLIDQALRRATRLHEESRMALEDLRANSEALEQTIESVQAGRAARAAQRAPPK